MKTPEYKKSRYGNSGYNSLIRGGITGFNKSYSERNDSFKGSEFNKNKGQEYSTYPMQWSPDESAEKKKEQSSQAKTRQLRSLIARSVAVVASATIIVSADPDLIRKQADASLEQPVAAAATMVVSAVWTWEEDNSGAVLTLTYDSGEKENYPTESVPTEQPARCTEEGTVTYTVSAEVNGTGYTDERVVTAAPPLGHSFGEGRIQSSGDQQLVMEYECSRCGEHFTIQLTATEE